MAYYPFNGNANDASGNGYNGQLIAGTFSPNRFGYPSGTLELNGDNQYVSIPNFTAIDNAEQATFSCWVKSPSIGNKADTVGNPIFMRWLAGGSYAGAVGLIASETRGLVTTAVIGGIGTESPTAPMVSDQWQQLVVVFDGRKTNPSERLKYYVNSVGGLFKDYAGVNPARLGAVGTVTYIGRYAWAPISFKGKIDDVRIYNRALTDNEVKALYDYESTPPDNSFITNGLVAYYPFNGNANDESGNGNTGQISGPTLAPDRFGYGNSAYDFSSNKGDKVLVSHNPSLNIVGDLTISSWVKVADLPQYRTAYTIVAKREQGGSQMPYLMGVNMQYGLPDDYNRFMFGSANGSYQFKQSVQLPNKSWCQVATSISGSQIAFYLNGELVGVDTINPSLRVSNNGPLVIGSGQRTDIPAEFFNGLIDDVRIYNRALSDAEVKALYNYESTPAIQSPVLSVQPQSQSVTAGNDATFCVTLKDAGTYNYQWQFNEQNIAGATLSCYTVNSVTTAMNGGRYRVIVSNSAGTVISDSATLTVVTPPPPAISSQPIGRTVQEGSNVSFAVVATGQGSLVYQWQLNEQNLPGATSATLNLNGVKQNQSGRYRVLVSSPYGVTISDTVTLTVNPNPPPTIVTQPISSSPAEGTQVSLTVTATGLGALTYQWQVNNQNIPGATSSTLVLSAVRPSANGKYRVIVGNPYGTTISTEATVTVVVTDADSDGLSDYEELLFGTNINKADSDGDGLSDFAEVKTHGSNPLTTDTDGDGYSDGIEVARDGNPNNRSATPTGALAVFPAVDVEFYTLNGVKYQLEVSTDMVQWTAQGGVVVGNGGSQNHLVRASRATQFWRLKVVQ